MLNSLAHSPSPALFPYQRQGADWLASRKLALLADEMGIGKTAQAIRACDLIGAKRVLVLCPAVARLNWLREFQRFGMSPRTITPILSSKERFDAHSQTIICSYDLTEKHLARLKKCAKWDALILDESHYLKSLSTHRTKAVLGKDGLIHHANRTWALSGTPAPNHPGELWPLLYTFGVTPLKYDEYVEKFCNYYTTGFNTKQITGARRSAIAELRQTISKVMLRRKKEDVLTELPPISFHDIVVEASPVDIDVETSFVQYVFPNDRRHELEARLAEERAVVDGILSREAHLTNRMAALEALASGVSTLRRYTGLQKTQKCAEMVADELESGAYEKIVIFAIHRDVIEGLRVRLSKFRPVTLYGATPPNKRDRNIEKFTKNPKCRVFIGNIQAAGTAITLTAAHQVLFVEQDWVPGNNAQAAMRCHRIGQKKPVTVRYAALANSFDEKVAATLKRKTKDLVQIFDGRGSSKENENEKASDVADFTPLKEMIVQNEGKQLPENFEVGSEALQPNDTGSCGEN